MRKFTIILSILITLFLTACGSKKDESNNSLDSNIIETQVTVKEATVEEFEDQLEEDQVEEPEEQIEEDQVEEPEDQLEEDQVEEPEDQLEEDQVEEPEEQIEEDQVEESEDQLEEDQVEEPEESIEELSIFPEKFHIKQISDQEKLNFYPIIKGNYIFWQQFPDSKSKDNAEIYLYKTLQDKLERVGYIKTVFGNQVKIPPEELHNPDTNTQVYPKINDNYIVWIEKDLKLPDLPGKLFFTFYDSKLLKNLVSPNIKKIEDSAFFLDESKVYIYQGTSMDPWNYQIYNLKTRVVEKNFSLTELFHTELLNGKSDNEFFFIKPIAFEGNFFYLLKKNLDNTDELIRVNINTKQLLRLYEFKAGFMDNSIYFIKDGIFYWSYLDLRSLPYSTNISSLDLKTIKKKDLATGIDALYYTAWSSSQYGPAPVKSLKGFSANEDYLLWVVASQKEQEKNGIFVKNLDTGEIKNILKNNEIKYAWDYTWPSYVQQMLYENKIVFAGYEGDLNEDAKNVQIYSLSL